MKINVSNEVVYLENGTYIGEIQEVFEYPTKDGKTGLCMKFRLEDDTIFNKFFDNTDFLGKYPWNMIFKALNTDNTDDLVGKNVEFEVKNNSKNGKEYSNIKKIKLI